MDKLSFEIMNKHRDSKAVIDAISGKRAHCEKWLITEPHARKFRGHMRAQHVVFTKKYEKT